MAKPAYAPGVCNINHAEVAIRKRTGYFGTSALIVLGGLMLLGEASWWLRLVLFLPAFIGAIGFLQARNRFCVSYAASGLQNAREGSSKARKVSSDASHTLDKAKARKLNLQATAIAALATALLAFI